MDLRVWWQQVDTWTAVDPHYETIRRDIVALFAEIGPYPRSACRGIDKILSMFGTERLVAHPSADTICSSP